MRDGHQQTLFALENLVRQYAACRRHKRNTANALRFERQLTPWFFGSAGYLYSHYDADASFALDETYVSGTPGFARRWRSPRYWCTATTTRAT